MAELQFPLKVGTTCVSDLFPAERIKAHAAKLGGARSMLDLVKDYAIYWPLLVYANVPLAGRDPMAAFRAESGREAVPVTITFRRPMFFDSSFYLPGEWLHRLFLLEREHWPAFRSFMGTMAMVDRGAREFYRVREQIVSIADPLALETASVLPSPCPMTDVSVFCVESTRGFCYVKPLADPLLAPSLVWTHHVDEKMKIFAEAIFDGNDNPYAQIPSPELPQDVGLQEMPPVKDISECDEKRRQEAVELSHKWDQAFPGAAK